jgi:hypothetical protein
MRYHVFWGSIQPASQAILSGQAPMTWGWHSFSGEAGEAKGMVDMAEAQEEGT